MRMRVLGLDWLEAMGKEWLLGGVGSRLLFGNESGDAGAAMKPWGLGPGSL